MSRQAVEDFFECIEKDALMREEFLESVPPSVGSGAPIVAFAVRKGFRFNEEELRQGVAARGPARPLSDEELDAVAGGQRGADAAGPTERQSASFTVGGRTFNFEGGDLSFGFGGAPTL